MVGEDDVLDVDFGGFEDVFDVLDVFEDDGYFGDGLELWDVFLG